MKSLISVTSRARLGLILVSELAHADALVSIETVAGKAKASRKFLELVAGDLRRAGIVVGVRGAAGGYKLARDAKSVTVADVLNAVEGQMERAVCTAVSHKTDIGIISKVQGQVMATLMNTSIADIV